MGLAKDYWETRGNDGTDRENPRDFYPTPPSLTYALLQREKFSFSILEPASGDGAMAKVLQAHGYGVEEADLDRGQDFLVRKAPCCNVVTNPPYSNGMGEKFARQALKLARRKVAMLMPYYFLEGVCRHDLFNTKKFPLKSLYIFSRRPKFGDSKHCSPFGTVWLVWDRTFKGSSPSVGWIL